MSKKIENLQKSIERIENKEQTIVFNVPDTQGTPKGDVIQAYLLAELLQDAGFNITMLYEKKDYTRVGLWLGEKYEKLPHATIEENNLKVSPADILIIPEAYSHIVEQTQNLPMNKVVFVQDYENMLNGYLPGKSWANFGVHETLTVSESAAELIKPLVRSVNVQVVPPIVDDEKFHAIDELKIPQIAFHSRNTAKTLRVIKELHLKYPALKWMLVKDIHSIPYEYMNEELGKSAVSVWINHESSFGTFPIESIKAGTPVIALVPSRLPEWYDETNESVIWTYDETEIVDFIARYMRGWLEDALPEEFKDISKNFIGKYNKEISKEAIITAINNINERRLELMRALLDVEINKNEEENKTV